MGVSLNTVQRMLLQKDVCRVHMSSLKPTLTEENKMTTATAMVEMDGEGEENAPTHEITTTGV